ncbi:Nucleotidylyl transferase [Anaeromyces robustus]|uniref:Nucleotidylyl transferase n=1 Tax=Anaeromyces robustus TaxID=1754192 RepID=A0A1Y1XGU6_9FUNG|nr:Nucleotidylyl transferase [Anaeromyces robustus]|eukprot:ORX84955.1 Nucleotidylyl transferase [Anaeromyces robustus]
MELQKEYDSICVYIHLERLNSNIIKYKSLIQDLTLKANKRLDILIHCNEIVDLLNDNHLWKKWKEVESLLSNFYVMTSQKTYQCGKILLDVNVIFDKWCDYDIFIEDSWDILVLTNKNDIEEIEDINEQRYNMELSKLKYIYNSFFDVKTETDIEIENTEEPTCFLENNGSNKDCHPTVALGGTFDHLHNGHKILLSISAWIASKKIICGVSDDELLKNKKGAELLEPIYQRCYNVQKFLYRIRRNLIYYIIPIHNGYGPTIVEKDIQAIVGSLETLNGCRAVNNKRELFDFPLLDIFSISLLAPKSKNLGLEDAVLKMSSSSIRLHLLGQNESEDKPI